MSRTFGLHPEPKRAPGIRVIEPESEQGIVPDGQAMRFGQIFIIPQTDDLRQELATKGIHIDRQIIIGGAEYAGAIISAKYFRKLGDFRAVGDYHMRAFYGSGHVLHEYSSKSIQNFGRAPKAHWARH